MPRGRMVRVNRLLQTTLAELVPRLLKDPRLGSVPFVSISAVRATGDLSNARVFVAMPVEDAAACEDVLAALRRAQGFLRRELGRRLRLRRIPELVFELDPVPAQAARIEALLEEVRAEEGRAGEGQGGTDAPGAAPPDVPARGRDES